MRLPPVDELRTPLLVPLGNLVLQAAWLDNALVAFVAELLPFGPETSAEQVAHELRNWKPEFITRTIDDAINNPELVADLHDFVRRLGELRERRHRMIHDAMEVGIDDEPDGVYRAIILREGYVREGKRTSRHLERLTADDVAALAHEFYDHRLEIDTFLGRLYDVRKEISDAL